MAKKKKAESAKKNDAGRSGKSVNKRYEKTPETNEKRESTKPSDSSSDKPEQNDFPIIGIGASAGGLQPLKDFLDAFPKDPGVALVIIQHLDPTRKSLAPELLAPHTSMKLCEVVDNPRVRPNSVYVIP